MELYNKYRPTMLKDVVGQPDAVRVLSKFIKDKNVPHAIMFTGPSGCGKTTLAGILANKITEPLGIHDLNCATIKPMETIQDIQSRMLYTTFAGKPQVWIMDEFQALSRAGFAQQGCLKIFEKPPSHAYFFLCTTDPLKIIPTIRNRCTEIKLRLLATNELGLVLGKVLMAENKKTSLDVLEKICEIAQGSPRRALVLLESIINLDNEAQQLSQLARGDFQAAGIDLAKALLQPGVKWPTIAKILLGFEDVEPEDARRVVMAYSRAVMLKNFKLSGRCNEIITAFREPFYDVGNAAACLANCCFDLCRK